jgi:hypothetical protein
MRIDERVCAFRAVELPVLACFVSSCSEESEIGRALKFCDIHSHDFLAKLWTFCDCILLYLAVEC